jgi:predicted permease
MDSFGKDIGYGFQQLLKSPGFAITAIISLALGIASTTSVFSVIYGVLLNPYPYAHSERMVHLIVKTPSGADDWIELTGPEVRTLRRARAVQSVAAQEDWDLIITGTDVPEDVQAVYLTANGTTHFGVPALLGRGFLPSDAPDGEDAQAVAVLSYRFWQHHYGGDPNIIGQRLELTHKPYTIVGVMPRRFTWGGGDGADVYLPLQLPEDPAKVFFPLILLKPGVSLERADGEFQALLQQFAKDPQWHGPKEFHVDVQGLNERFVKRLGSTLALLFGAVTLLLLIGCGNVSILLLARGTGRRHELWVRAAIGATRGRIVRQLLTEALTLAITGAALGIALSYGVAKAMKQWLPEGSMPNEADIAINLPVLGFCVVVAVSSTILFGLSPALRFSRPDIAQVIAASGRRLIGGVGGKRTHELLVAGQLALTLLLLSAAGTAAVAFLKLTNAKLGYDPTNVMCVGIPIHDNTYKTWEARSAYFRELRTRVAAMPEVVSTAISSNATPPENGSNVTFEIRGRPLSNKIDLRLNLISPEYFAVLHIPLLRGRLWNEAENVRGAKLAVINETMAKRYWPNGDGIGQEIRFPNVQGEPPYRLVTPDPSDWVQIVGVVGDARDDGLLEPEKPQAYIPYTDVLGMYTQLLVKSRVPPLSLLHGVRRRIQQVNPDQQTVKQVRDLNQWIKTRPEWAQERFVAMLFGAFSIVGLALSAVGLYSMVSYAVAQRTNEFGLRMAMGAQPADVLRNVLRGTFTSVGFGIGTGLLLSALFSGFASRWLQGGSQNPLLLVGVVALLALTCLLASMFPARRASRIDPMVALRYE